MERAHGIVLRDVLGTKAHIRGWVIKLKRINHAALHGWNNLATGQLRNRHAQLLHKVGRQANSAVFEALELCCLFGRGVFKPAQGLRGHRESKEAHDVQIKFCNQLVPELLAAAFVNP